MNVVSGLSVCMKKGYRNKNEIGGKKVWGTASGRDARKHRSGMRTRVYRFYGLVEM